jgi:hypothetical protein
VILALLIRASISAGIVAAAAVAAQRLGPLWGGLLAALPVSAGPAYAMLGMSHSAAFVGQAATNGLGANAATAVFLFILIHAVPRLGMLWALALASLGWMGLTVGVLAWAPGFWPATGLNVLCYGLAILGTRGAVDAGPPAMARAARWWELPLRSIVLGLLVASLVSFSSALGPVWTGAGAVYPVGLTTLTLVAVPRMGRAAAAALLAGALRGMPGFVLFMMVLAMGAEALGVAGALALGVVASLGWGALVLGVRRRQAPARRPQDRHSRR